MEDKKHGNGKYTLANGDIIKDSYENNERNGLVIFIYADGREDEEVMYLKGKIVEE